MGSQYRFARHVLRDRVLAAAVGGALLGGSILGVSPEAQAATIAAGPAAATQIAQVAQQIQDTSEDVGLIPSRAHTRFVERVAIRRATRAVGIRHGYRHLCLLFVRTRYGVPKRAHTAIRAWSVSRHKHRHDRNPPAGVPVFWSGGSRGGGHVAISLGHGMIVSTDMPRAGHVGRIRLSTIARRWHLRYLGWTEDLNGVRIYRR
jgi:hypothetical protein